MSRPPLPLLPRPARRGETVNAELLNRPRRALAAFFGGVAGRGPQVGGPSILLPIRQFRYVSMDDDFIVCREWDGATAGLQTYIAKPYLLRRSITSRDSITYTYTDAVTRQAAGAGSPTETEDQVVVPSYVVDDVIYAARVSGGLFDIEAGSPAAVVEWLDINADGRAWAKSA